MTPLRVTPKEAKRLGAKPTPRDSSHERDAPEAERMPSHVHGIWWERLSKLKPCPMCGELTTLLADMQGCYGCVERCCNCPECGVTARALWERANR